MKDYFKICFSTVLALSFLAGCATTEGVKTSITSEVSSLTSNVDPAIVSQIPADKKEGFPQAEFALNVADQKVKLAKLKSELASDQKKLAGYEEDLASNFQKEAEIDYDLVKIEAIINAGLGKKEDNPKIKANLQSKKSKSQVERIKINSSIDVAKLKVKSLSEDITKLDEAIKAMKFEGGKASAASSEPKEKVKK
jgi:outer membrane murein-binding lipoprotein Lpp